MTSPRHRPHIDLASIVIVNSPKDTFHLRQSHINYPKTLLLYFLPLTLIPILYTFNTQP